MFISLPNTVGPIVELVANSASLIVIFSEEGMGSGRKMLLLMLLGSRIWHRGSSNGITGWMCSIWTTLQ